MAKTPPPTPPVQPVFIRLTRRGPDFGLEVFFDPLGDDVMTNDKPLNLLGNGQGKIQFNFIPPASGGELVTGDLVIIAQTVRDQSTRLGHRRDTPFRHPFGIPVGKFYPTYYLPSPAGDADPTNLKCELKCGPVGFVVGGTVDVIKSPGGKRSNPYKYTIVALCDGATKVTDIDPTVIINPR